MRIINKIYVEENQVHNIVNVMTVSNMVALPFLGVEDLKVCGGSAYLVARLHSRCEYPTNDPDVCLRALAFMPRQKMADHVEDSQIYRVTIRKKYLDLDSSYVAEALSPFRHRHWGIDQELATTRVADYHRLAAALLEVPVVDLTDPLRPKWPQWAAQ